MSKECPICGSEEIFFVQDEVKDAVKTDVYRCERCDFDFLNIWDDVNYVKSLYEGDRYIFTHNVSDDDKQELKYDEYEARYRWMKPYLGKDKTLLEIGCGDGKFLRMVHSDVLSAEGVELSPPQVARLRSEGFTCYDVMIDEMEPSRKYDVICMFALLEHVPLIRRFLHNLKGYMHQETDVFIEVPNLNDPLISGFDLKEFRNFYYRSEHLYYFRPNALKKLLGQEGFSVELKTSQQASITNHFHWMHNRCGQPNANYMASVASPVAVMEHFPMNEILEKVDDYYRTLLEENLMGDLLSAHIRLLR